MKEENRAGRPGRAGTRQKLPRGNPDLAESRGDRERGGGGESTSCHRTGDAYLREEAQDEAGEGASSSGQGCGALSSRPTVTRDHTQLNVSHEGKWYRERAERDKRGEGRVPWIRRHPELEGPVGRVRSDWTLCPAPCIVTAAGSWGGPNTPGGTEES